MPTAYIEKMAKKHDISVSKAEGIWEDAKQAAKKEGEANNYAYITGVFKKLIGEPSSVAEEARARLNTSSPEEAALIPNKGVPAAAKQILAASNIYEVPNLWLMHVNSSNIEDAAYSLEHQLLFINFKGQNFGDWYVYEEVPAKVWPALTKAPSKGAYFAKSIKGQYKTSLAKK